MTDSGLKGDTEGVKIHCLFSTGSFITGPLFSVDLFGSLLVITFFILNMQMFQRHYRSTGCYCFLVQKSGSDDTELKNM